KFILEKELRWIPYNKFKNVEYLNEGGFDKEVILKCHKNLNENLNEFLKEWEYHASVFSSNNIINFHGFTKDPNTSKYMVVMDYANKGNLRENLTIIVENNWKQKLYSMLYEIISGLSEIHSKRLIHCDFHDGNILNHNKSKIYISDLGLCQPVRSFLEKYDIYGVIPFMAPEVLRGKSYTPASDIYSFSMIMWEFTSGIPPFNNRAHDLQLSLSICKEVQNVIKSWIFRPYTSNKVVSEELKSNIMEFINAPIGHNNLATKSHPKACYTSRLLDFTSKKLNEILDNKNTSKKLNEILESEDSQATSVKSNEMLVSEDLNDYIIKNLGSLGMYYDI
ncbi:kinase-like domain-containing protein, partial [Rhizophagus diaphanus]